MAWNSKRHIIFGSDGPGATPQTGILLLQNGSDALLLQNASDSLLFQGGPVISFIIFGLLQIAPIISTSLINLT